MPSQPSIAEKSVWKIKIEICQKKVKWKCRVSFIWSPQTENDAYPSGHNWFVIPFPFFFLSVIVRSCEKWKKKIMITTKNEKWRRIKDIDRMVLIMAIDSLNILWDPGSDLDLYLFMCNPLSGVSQYSNIASIFRFLTIRRECIYLILNANVSMSTIPNKYTLRTRLSFPDDICHTAEDHLQTISKQQHQHIR